jgi:simple sugar transport system permease protein
MIRFQFYRRENTTARINYVIPIASFILALLVSSVLLIIQGIQPVEAYKILFLSPIADRFGIIRLANVSSILLLASLAVYVPLKANLYNIGAEGQLYIGAILSVWIGVTVDAGGIVLIPLMIVGSMIGGGMYGAIPGYLRAKWGVNEILVTLLSIFIAYGINRFLVLGPLAREDGGFPASEKLPESGLLPEIGGPHIGIIFAAMMLISTYIFFNKTSIGYKSMIYGSNPSAAKLSGISEYKVILVIMIFGSLLAGVSGMIVLSGELERLRLTIGPGYGLLAVAIAFLGRNGVPQVTAAGLLFSFLSVGGRFLEAQLSVPIALIDVIQATMVIALVSGEFIKERRISIDLNSESREGNQYE